jgi:hypothetical protein
MPDAQKVSLDGPSRGASEVLPAEGNAEEVGTLRAEQRGNMISLDPRGLKQSVKQDLREVSD